MTIKLEHANLTVRNLDAMVLFLTTAFPDFSIRREGLNQGRRWMHLGTSDTYLALNEASAEPAETWVPYSGKPGANHLGYEVDDVEALQQRLREAGYRDTTYPNNHPHRKRVYFADPEGNDWEFVQYLSELKHERNDYELAD